MRIATWNVNSLKARQEAVEKWLARAEPDVLLMQETKLADADAPVLPMRMLGYELAHHGEGRWNGVAILSRVGIEDVITNFGDGPVRDSTAGAAVAVSEDDFDPSDEARMVSAVCGGIRVVSLYAPNGRVVGSPFYEGKLRWFDRVARWLAETRSPDEPLVLAGDYNVTPADIDVWSPARAHGGTHVSAPEREALARLRDWGLRDTYREHQPEGGRFSWWDYRAGMFHKNEGMRIDLLYATSPVADRVTWAEIDREARKGPPTPSDHAPVVIDLDEPGRPFDAGWEGALSRIAARSRPRAKG
jgi:exodeoxyribonuclease-3